MSKPQDAPPPKNFEGIGPYLETASQGRGVSGEMAGKAGSSWYAKQVQNSLGSISENAGNIAISDADRSKMFDYAADVCKAVIAAAEGCVAAVEEMAERHGFDVPIASAGSELKALKAEYEAFKADAAKLAKAAEADQAELTKALSEAQGEIKALQAKLAAQAKAADAKAPAPAPAPTPAPAPPKTPDK